MQNKTECDRLLMTADELMHKAAALPTRGSLDDTRRAGVLFQAALDCWAEAYALTSDGHGDPRSVAGICATVWLLAAARAMTVPASDETGLRGLRGIGTSTG